MRPGGEPRIERVGQELLDTFLGMTSEEAARVARSEGLACRLRNEEDPKELVSADWSFCRVNLWLDKNGKVIRAGVG